MKALGDDTELLGRAKNNQLQKSRSKIAGLTMAVKDHDDVADKTKEASINLSISRPMSAVPPSKE